MLKLKELKAMIPETGKMDRVPTYKKLRESGCEIVVKEVIDQDTEVMVYDNGLVVYRNFRRITIFPLHTCNSYSYEDGNHQNLVYEKVFEDEAWYLRLILEGEDRLAQNQRTRDAFHRVVSYSAISEEWKLMEDESMDLLQSVMRKETLDKLMLLLNEQEKEILLAYYVEGISQEQIAEAFEVTQQNISYLIRAAVKKSRRLLEDEPDCAFRMRNKK